MTLGFVYDGLGRRTLHLLRDTDGAERHRRFVWSDGPTPFAEVDDAGELLSLYSPQGEWHRDGAARLYLRDHLGSIVAQTDAAGTIVGRYRTDPWGRTLEREGAGSLMGFASMVRIEAGERMEMLLTPARAYDPHTARWMSRDPLDEMLRGTKYGYAGANPTTNVEPMGLSFASAVVVATGGCSRNSFADDVMNNFVEVQDRTSLAKVGISLAFGGAFAKRYGGLTVLGAIADVLRDSRAGFAITGLGSRTFLQAAATGAATWAINGILIKGIFDAGVLAGSVLRTAINRAASASACACER